MSPRKLTLLSSWTPVVLWAAVIFYLSSIPGLNSGLELDFILRKCAHMFEYFVLTRLLIRAFENSGPSISMPNILAWSAVLSLLYAVSDEIHQAFVPNRGPSVKDVLVDAVGIAACLFFVRRGRPFEREKA